MKVCREIEEKDKYLMPTSDWFEISKNKLYKLMQKNANQARYMYIYSNFLYLAVEAKNKQIK